ETIDADQIDDIMNGRQVRPRKDWQDHGSGNGRRTTEAAPDSGAPPKGEASIGGPANPHRRIPRSVYSLACGARTLTLSAPVVMGVLNVTPDSFSDGGRFVTREAALAQARRMVEEGAAIIDVGGESTRPGAAPVSEAEELERVVPVVEAIARELDVIISLDTSTPAVMREGAHAGAGLINDVRALCRPGALEA